MELTKENMLPFLISHMQLVTEKPDRKWLFEFKHMEKPWSSADFQSVWANLRAQGHLKETVHEEVLEVVAEEGDQSGLILEIKGVANITRYCHHETPSCTPHAWKQRVLVSKDMLPDELPVSVFSVVQEERLLQLETEPSVWLDVPKYYILHKKFMYESDDFTYILCFKRRSNEPYTLMRDSGVTSGGTTYEVSMECKKMGEDPSHVIGGIVSYIQAIQNDYFVLSKQQQDEVLHGYHTLIKKKLVETRRREDNGEKPYFFFAPKPITLEKMHILNPDVGYGIVSIQSGYAVTEKADGERILLYVHSDGHAYLINNTLDVRSTGLRAKSQKMHSSLVDGEYVPSSKRKDNDQNDLFMAFDIYFLGGESVMDLPLIHNSKPSRVSKLSDIIETSLWDIKEDGYLDISVKQHIPADGDGMFAVCKQVLSNAAKLPYEIDGLVFTPRDLPVFGYYPNKPVKITENVRWDRVFKWKPSEQNTIDFLVETDDHMRVHPITKQPYVSMKLFTGYNATQWESITVMEGVRMRYDREYSEHTRNLGEVYRAKLFKPISQYEKGVEEAHVPLVDGVAKAENGDIISNKTIVEFAYNPDPKVHPSRRWVPLRVRDDKTRIFQRTNKLSKTANDLSVAMSIWRTIHNPVTTAMITGVQQAAPGDAPDELEERLLGVDDTYYAREIPRQHMLSVHMLNFHNQGIKKKLYHLSQSRDALLELACGMAGDLPRWRDAGYRFVLGVDLVRDNITHPREGSYARVQKQKRKVITTIGGVEKVIYPDMVFAIGDCALPLHDGSAANEFDEESKKLLRLVYRRDNVAPAPYLKYITGRAARGFDVVSCMFAVHYFFQTPEKLHGFLSNVSRNLKKNGIFIATFMDGDKVNGLLESTANGVAEGKKLDGQATVWAIVKRYSNYKTDDEEPFGKLVDVYLENTNRLIPEFLVNLDTLVQHASAHGLELADTALFSHTFAEIRANVPEDPHKRTHLDNDVLQLEADEVQKQFSFLNRWVVFRKI
jgi:SAM-dependent methyltransferase